jgi:hypothetical protein
MILENRLRRCELKFSVWGPCLILGAAMVKVNLSLCLTNQTQRHKDIWGVGIDPHFPDLGTSWR